MKATAEAAMTLDMPPAKAPKAPKRGGILKDPNQFDMFERMDSQSLESMADDILAQADAAEAAAKLQEATAVAIAATPALAAELDETGRSNLDFARFMRSADMSEPEINGALAAIGAEPQTVMRQVAQVETKLELDTGDFEESSFDSDSSDADSVADSSDADESLMVAGDSRGADSTALFLSTLRAKRFDPASHEQMAELALLVQAGEAANKQFLTRGPAAPKLQVALLAAVQGGVVATAELARLQAESKRVIAAYATETAELVAAEKLKPEAGVKANAEFAKANKVDPDREEFLKNQIREAGLARDNLAARDATPAEVAAWEVPMKAGLRARDELINRNMRYMVTMARRSIKTGRPFDDLIQAGSEGLIEAAMRFDPAKGKFTTIATWWILQKIQRSVQADANMPIPSYLPGQEAKLRRMAEAATTPEAKADLLSKAEKAATRLESRRRNAVSLDSSRGGDGEDDGANMLSMLEAENPGQEEQLERLQLVTKLSEFAQRLETRERDIFLMRIGLHPEYPGDSCTLAEIAAVHNISRERVRQCYVEAATAVSFEMHTWAGGAQNLPTGFRKGLLNPGKG